MEIREMSIRSAAILVTSPGLSPRTPVGPWAAARVGSWAALAVMAWMAPTAGASLFSTVGGQFQATAEIPGRGATNALLPLTQPGPGSNEAVYATTVTSAVSYSFN